MIRKIVILFFITMFLAEPIFAANIPTSLERNVGKETLRALIKEALQNNPRLRAAKYRAQAAKARVTFFGSVPDPMLEYEYDKISPAATMADGEKIRPMKSVAVSQEIPFPTKLFMRRKSAQKEANSFEQEYKDTEQAVIKEVKEAYYNLFLNQRKEVFTKDYLGLVGQFVEVTNKKYAVNKAGQQDVLRAQVEHSKASNQLILYNKEVRIAETLLSSVLGRKDNSSIDITDADPVNDLRLSEDDIVALTKKGRPELKSFKEMLGKAQAESSLSKQELLPDVTVKYTREEKDGRLGGLNQGEWKGMVGVTFPLWFLDKQLPAIKEARANLEAAKADYSSAENTAVFEARSGFAKYEAARRLVGIYETGVLPQAESAVTTARRAYESGSLSFLELLDSLRMFRELQMEYFESVAELQMAIADLERSVGSELEKSSYSKEKQGDGV